MSQTHTDDLPGVINALTDPWVGAVTRSGDRVVVSPAELIRGAQRYTTFADQLRPLEREAVNQFVFTLAGLVCRLAGEEMHNGGLDPDREAGLIEELLATGVDEVVARYGDCFWLRHPERPFLQDWAPRSIGDPYPLYLLDAQYPGDSSSQWGRPAVSPGERSREIASDPALLVTLLVSNYWMSRRSNAAGLDGQKRHAGAPGVAGVWSMMVHPVGPTVLHTILANVLTKWVDGSDLPAYLDQTAVHAPGSTALEPQALFRSTYSYSLPKIAWDGNGQAIGWSFAQSTTPAPLVDKDTKESLKVMHRDHWSRISVVSKKSKTGEIVYPAPPDVRLTSVVGYSRWFNHDKGSASEGLGPWLDRTSRLLGVPLTERAALASWRLGVLRDIAGVMGNRTQVGYEEIEAITLTPASDADGRILQNKQSLLVNAIAGKLRGHLALAATGSRRAGPTATVPMAEAARRRFLSGVELHFASHLADDPSSFDPAIYTRPLRKEALASFDAAVAPLALSKGEGAVAIARREFEGSVDHHVKSFIQEFNREASTP